MLPKVLGIAPLGSLQFALFALGLAAAAVLPLFHEVQAAQILHLILILNFLAFLLPRWPHRRGNPPPEFLFIGLALLADLTGTAYRILVLAGWVEPTSSRVEILLQYQAFPLLLILGVGGFLLPKLFRGWTRPSAVPGFQLGLSQGRLFLLGLIFLGSYGAELWESSLYSPRLAYGLRAAVWAWFLFGGLRLQGVSWKAPAYLVGAKFSLYAIGAGLSLPVFFPAYLLAWEHLLFVTGILWLTLAIATRVVMSHGGRPDLLEKRRARTLGYGALLALAAASRVSTDIWTGGHLLHLAVASVFALTALGIWTWIHFRLFPAFPPGGR